MLLIGAVSMLVLVSLNHEDCLCQQNHFLGVYQYVCSPAIFLGPRPEEEGPLKGAIGLFRGIYINIYIYIYIHGVSPALPFRLAHAQCSWQHVPSATPRRRQISSAPLLAQVGVLWNGYYRASLLYAVCRSYGTCYIQCHTRKYLAAALQSRVTHTGLSL